MELAIGFGSETQDEQEKSDAVIKDEGRIDKGFLTAVGLYGVGK
jgi:hypothetical protein